MRRNRKRILFYPALFILLVTFTACGLRDIPEAVSDGEAVTGSGDGTQEEPVDSPDGKADQEPAPASGGTTAVTDFYYRKLPELLGPESNGEYVINSEWLYRMEREWIIKDEDSVPSTYVSRSRITDGYQEENYIVRENIAEDGNARGTKAFLVDGKGDCYLFCWSRAEEDAAYTLEKYDADGELLWQTSCTPEELQGEGEKLTQGAVTEDGRVYLYSYGEGGKVFAFGEDGKQGEVYSPALKSLEGIAVGKEGRVYGYYVTGEEPLFQELGGAAESYVCPVVPLQVYDGHEDGLCLRTGEGMWGYEPETGETELLWRWEDDYVQVNGDYVDRLYRGKDGYMLLCQEHGISAPNRQKTLTFAAVRVEDSGAYPEKQTVTLSVGAESDRLDLMVKLYNRQNGPYRVEVVQEWDESLLERQLAQGRGADLINISELYAEHLAELGAFEDLEPYFEASGKVSEGDIVDSVRRACTVKGKLVAVIPAFSVDTLLAKEAGVTPQEWDVWRFLEMGRENRMLGVQGPDEALQYAMGIRYGEHFIDWEKKECSFDGEEFRRVLEECRTWKRYNSTRSGEPEEGDEPFCETQWISSVWNIVSDADPDYSARLVGYPGWDGGEYRLKAERMFAINSGSGNKAGAWDFLEYLLSEEYQGMVDWAFPARKSCFEAQLTDLYIDPSRLELSFFLGEPAVPTEEEISLLRDMVDCAVRDDWGGRNNPIWNIVAHEAGAYFSGDATLDDTVGRIQNRMRIYLQE